MSTESTLLIFQDCTYFGWIHFPLFKFDFRSYPSSALNKITFERLNGFRSESPMYTQNVHPIHDDNKHIYLKKHYFPQIVCEFLRFGWYVNSHREIKRSLRFNISACDLCGVFRSALTINYCTYVALKCQKSFPGFSH